MKGKANLCCVVFIYWSSWVHIRSLLYVRLQSQQPLWTVSTPAATDCNSPQSSVHLCSRGQRYTATHGSRFSTSFSHCRALPPLHSACNQPWLRHTAVDQFFSFNPTTILNHHTYHTHSYCGYPRHCNIPVFPTLIKGKNTFSRYCTLGIKDFRKIWFIEDMTLLCVP